MENYTISDLLVFDAETTGLPPKGAKWETDFSEFPNLVSLSWIYNGVEKSYIIYPDGWEIPADSVEIHGITTEYALQHGTKVDKVLADFAEDILIAALVGAHNIYFDSSVVKANILKHLGQEFYDEYRIDEGLHKSKRVDTMMKTIKFVGATFENSNRLKFPKLEELFNKIFPGETFEAHNSLEDCRAVLRCLPELINLGIIELKIKEYDTEPAATTKPEPIKPTDPPKEKIVVGAGRVATTAAIKLIDINDPSPVVIPGANGENIPEQKADQKGLGATEIKTNNPLLDLEDF